MENNRKENNLSHSRLTSLLSYDSETGDFVRKVDHWASAKAGKKVGSRHSEGYLECMIDGQRYYLHRLAWFYVHKKWPDGVIDHINHDRKDNRLSNLRDVTVQGNILNMPLKSSNRTGVKGVHLCKRSGKYIAQITVDYKTIHLGSFDLIENAAEARRRAEERLHALVYSSENQLADKKHEVDLQRASPRLVKKSQYKGVMLHHSGKWGAQITYQKEHHWLGLFDTEESAHRAYIQAKAGLTGGANG